MFLVYVNHIINKFWSLSIQRHPKQLQRGTISRNEGRQWNGRKSTTESVEGHLWKNRTATNGKAEQAKSTTERTEKTLSLGELSLIWPCSPWTLAFLVSDHLPLSPFIITFRTDYIFRLSRQTGVPLQS